MDTVALVTPPSGFLLDERVFVSLGILKVAAALDQAGYSIDHLDLSGVDPAGLALEDFLKRTPAKVVGFTCTTPQLPAVTELISVTRRVRPEMRVILGGPHVTLVHAAARLERERSRISRATAACKRLEQLADVLVAGDGERAVLAALTPPASWPKDNLAPPKASLAPVSLDPLNLRAHWIDGDDPQGPYFLTHADFEASPWPARHLVSLDTYHYEIDGLPATSIVGQLGCPFGCRFCGGRHARSLRRVRQRSAQSIVAEVRHLHETYGYRAFMFYDDELNLSPKFLELLKGLTQLQKDLGVEMRFRGFVKSELFTAEQADAMARAGFRWLLCGFESGSPRILTNINKKATLEDNTRTLATARSAGLKVKALMSLGHAGESEDTAKATRDWLAAERPDDFDCTIITPYPGTPYYDEALASGSSEQGDAWVYIAPETGDRLYSRDVDYSRIADYYKGDPNGGYRSYVWTETLSVERIVALRAWIEDTVRKQLGIPYPKGRAALRYDHSMGQGQNNTLPAEIYRHGQAQRRRSRV